MEKHYITPLGFRNLQEQLRELLYKERPKITEVIAWAAANGDRSENADYIYGKKRLREIDKKIEQLSKILDNAQVIDPKTIKASEVRFGATVTVIDEEGEEKEWSIVGIPEVDPSNGLISWQSPIARALIGKREGDWVEVKTPKGEQEFQIIKIRYTEKFS